MGIIKMSDMSKERHPHEYREDPHEYREDPHEYREDPDTFYSNPVADGIPQLIILG